MVLRTSKEGLNLTSNSNEQFDFTLAGNMECIDLSPSAIM